MLTYMIIFTKIVFVVLPACIMLTESPAYEKVLQYCDEVLQLSPHNVKALYRKGVALYNLSRLDDALEELVKARSQPTGQKGIMQQ